MPARRSWPLRVVPLAAGAVDDLSATTTVAQRLAFVEALAREAWALARRPLPDYDRAHIPVRLVRNGPTGDHRGP